VLGVATATVVLLLALASLLVALQDDPGTLGKRYELTARQGAASLADVRGVAGVEAAERRIQVDASAAYALGQPLRLIGFPRGAEDFEAPPLAEGRRRRGPREAEVGIGLAETLGLGPGSTLAVALPTGEEVRFRVVGLVRALENEGRVAYVRSDAIAGAGAESLAVVLDGGADPAAVSRGLTGLGAVPAETGGATTDNRGFLAILATLLRVVALTVALVCLVVLAQALVVTARERRATLALLRTVGADRGAVTAVLAGACAIVLVPAAIIGVALETVVLGPAVASLAAGYAGCRSRRRSGTSCSPSAGWPSSAASRSRGSPAASPPSPSSPACARSRCEGARRRPGAARRPRRRRPADRPATTTASPRSPARPCARPSSTPTATARSSAARPSGCSTARRSRRAAARRGRSPGSDS
jgi:hypothetical protein